MVWFTPSSRAWLYNVSMQKHAAMAKLLAVLLALMLISGCQAFQLKTSSSSQQVTQAVLNTPAPSPMLRPPTQEPTPRLSKTTPSPICTEKKGAWQADALPAKGLDAETPFQIYLPPCYDFDSKTRYPLLILLHGSGPGGDENMWPGFGLADVMNRKIAEGMPPFLVVTPRIYNLQGDFLAISEAIAKTLVTYVDDHYRAKASADYRALGGLSYGAIWTLRTATVYPEDFSKLGLHSNAAQLDDMVAFSQKMLTVRAENRPLIWLDAGVNDYYLWSNTKMDEVLNNDHINHFWHLGPGAHDAAYWRANLDDYLSFYSAGW